MSHDRSQALFFPQKLLLTEIERYCSFPDCRTLNRIGLTKEEAIDYRGYECHRCERWNADELSRRDVPEWWESDKL